MKFADISKISKISEWGLSIVFVKLIAQKNDGTYFRVIRLGYIDSYAIAMASLCKTVIHVPIVSHKPT